MLTEQEKEQYREQGYVLVSGIFEEAELVELESAFDEIVRVRLANRANLDATWEGEWKKEMGETQILHTHDLQAYHAAWSRALLQDRLTGAFADCLGSPNVQLHHTKLFQKPPEKGSAFPMHQDYPYFPHERHTMMAGILHLSDADEDMGCVCVYPGTHKNGPMDCHEHRHLDPNEYPIDGAVKCPAKRGDVLFFNYLTVHGSGINTSPRTRKTVLIQVRDPLDKPTKTQHISQGQGLMLRGVHPLEGAKGAELAAGNQLEQ